MRRPGSILVLHCFVSAALVVGTPAQEPPAKTSAETKRVEGPDGAHVIKDDGSVDSGYGFVPSAVEGTYVQEFFGHEFPHPYLDVVYICWLKTRGDRSIDFEILLFEDAGGRPAVKPFARFPAQQENVADSVDSAGSFVEVNVDGLKIPSGRFFMGATWNPKTENFLFVCVDRSEETEKVPVFFREEAQPWTLVFDARDPIFIPHRAILVRARSREGPPPVPEKQASPASSPPPLSQ